MNKLLLCIFSVLVFSIANSFGQTNTNIYPLTGPVGIGTLTPDLDFQLSIFDPIITNRDYRKSGISLTLDGTSEIDENSHLVLLGKDCSLFSELTRLTLPSDMYSALILHSGRGKLGDIIVTNRNEDGAIRFATTPPPPPPTQENPEPPAPDFERMRITNIGNVGIGNQNPKELLHLGERLTFHTGYDHNYIGNNIYQNADSKDLTCEKGYSSIISMTNQELGLVTIGVTGLLDENEEVSFEEDFGNYKGISIFHHDKRDRDTVGYAQITIGNLWPLVPNARFGIRSFGTDKETYAMFVQNAEAKELFVVNDAGKVGIGTSNPQAELDVSGSSIVRGNSSVLGSLNANGNLAISGTGNINGNTTIGGELSVSKITSPTVASGSNRKILQLPEEVRIGLNHYSGGLPSGSNNLLSVDGLIVAKEVKVTILDWADYVFGDDYQLKSIDELDAFIQANKHLPGIPKTDEVRANGVDLGQFQAKMLEKLEEMSLYIIQLKKQNDELKSEIDKIKESK